MLSLQTAANTALVSFFLVVNSMCEKGQAEMKVQRSSPQEEDKCS